MVGKATEISISMEQIDYPLAFPHKYKRTYKVRFYSIPKRCWCSFEHIEGDDYGYSSDTFIHIRTPRIDVISLSSKYAPFKVGKVSCRLIYRKSTRSDHWIIDDVEY